METLSPTSNGHEARPKRHLRKPEERNANVDFICVLRIKGKLFNYSLIGIFAFRTVRLMTRMRALKKPMESIKNTNQK